MKQTILNALGILFIGLITFSCQKDDAIGDLTPAPEEHGLYFSVKSPGTVNSAFTRAADTDISTLCVLYFKKHANNNYYLMDIEQAVSSTVAGTATFRLRNPSTVWDCKYEKTTYTKDMKLAFIANMPLADLKTKTGFSSVPSFKNLATAPTATLELSTVLKKIQVANATANSSIWPWNAAATENNIPMYMITENLDVHAGLYQQHEYIGGNTSIKTYHMLRMLAKIEITNNLTNIPSGKAKFTVSEINLVRGQSKGYVYFDESSTGISGSLTTTGSTAPTGRIKEPNLVDETTATAATNKFAQTTSTATKQVYLAYTFEAKQANLDIANVTTNCYIELKGTREGGSGTVTYMLPIPNIPLTAIDPIPTGTIKTDEAGPILRNHYYTFEITGVDDFGLHAVVKVKNWTSVKGTSNPIAVP